MTENKEKYNVYQVANCFIKLFKSNNKSLTHMQLQKLVYYSYAFFLLFYNKRLFENQFQAWAFGPVDHKLYTNIKKSADNTTYNISNVINVDGYNCLCNEEDMKEITTYIYNAFDGWNANELSDLTHKEGSAWDVARRKENVNLEDSDIQYEAKRIAESSNASI